MHKIVHRETEKDHVTSVGYQHEIEPKGSQQLELFCPMTVVIASLGGSSLRNTIEAINKGTIVPEEILICIPADEVHRIKDISFQNVKIIVTDCKGQVAQRIVGFQNASHTIVMQLDDDLLVDITCIEYLLQTLKMHGSQVSVAPALMNVLTRQSIYKIPLKNKIARKVYYWIMNGVNGYQPGKVSKSGAVIGVDPGNETKKLFEVEWLAGGCVMHHKKNLILTNFYPFKGKAYYEDIMHSFYLRKAEIKLMIDANAYCWLEPAQPLGCKYFEHIRQLQSDFRARKYTMKLLARTSFWMYFHYFLRLIFHTIKCI